jgi:hypothetical protein
MNHPSVKPQTVMVNNITSDNNMNRISVKPQTALVDIVDQYFLRSVIVVVHIAVAGYIVNHYCLMFHRGVVKHEIQNLRLTVMVNNITSDNNMNRISVKPQTALVNNITSSNNMNQSSVKHKIVMVNAITSHQNMNHCYIVDHYFLRFDRGVVHIVAAVYIVNH